MAVFIVAEAGVNHDGSLSKARDLVRAAAEAGADAVKFQTYAADQLVLPGTAKADYQVRGKSGGNDQLDMLRRLQLDHEAHQELAAFSRSLNVEFMSTAFDEASLRFLVEDIGVARLKVPSGEITNGPFLLQIARSGLPLIVSTGMSTLDEVREALGVLAYGMRPEAAPGPSRQAFDAAFENEEDRHRLTARASLLQCTSSYPTPIEETNLRSMVTLGEAFGLPVGLSDHTQGTAAAVAATALGATVVEKHLTLDCDAEGPDHAASIEPPAFREMVAGIRAVEAALGSANKAPSAAELAMRPAARRSLVALTTIRQGDRFTEANLGARRPGSGLNPMHYWELLGREAGRDYAEGDFVES